MVFNLFKKEKAEKAVAADRFPEEPRDGFKSKEYYIAQLQRVDDFQHDLEVATKNEDCGRKRYCTTIDQYLFRKIGLLYVLRADRQELAREAALYCRNTRERLQLGDVLTYNIVCRALSFATLFGLDDSEAGFLKDPLELQGMPEDAVTDLLRNALFTGQATTDKDFYYKDKGFHGDGVKDTGGLMKAIRADGQETRTAEFIKFLEAVKEKHHKRLLKHYEEIGENRYVYTGSYDFRLTAVAKVLDIDKDAVADSKFIAADLLWLEVFEMRQESRRSNAPMPTLGLISEAELNALVEQGLASKENKTKRTVGRVVLFGLAALLLFYGVSGLVSEGPTALVIEQLICAALCVVFGCLLKMYQRVRLKSMTGKQLMDIGQRLEGLEPLEPRQQE